MVLDNGHKYTLFIKLSVYSSTVNYCFPHEVFCLHLPFEDFFLAMSSIDFVRDLFLIVNVDVPTKHLSVEATGK